MIKPHHFRQLALTFVFILSFLSCYHQQPITTPWDTLRTNPLDQKKLRVVPADCGIRNSYPLKNGFEMWYTDILCSDGRMLLIYFKIGSLYRGVPRGAEVSINIYKEGEPAIMRSLYLDDFEASKEQCDISIGENRFFGHFPDYWLHLAIDDIRVRLHFKGLIKGYKLTDNRVLFGQGSPPAYNEWIVFLPRALATGELTIGDTTESIEGDVYMDHWLGNVPLDQTYAQCHWGKIYSERYSLIFLRAVAEKKYAYQKLGFFMLFDGDRLIASTDNIDHDIISSRFSPITGHTYPIRFTLNISDPLIQGRIHVSPCTVLAEINHVKSRLGSASPVLYPLVRLILGDPYSYGMLSRARANFDIRGQKVSFQGMMFHEIDNKKESVGTKPNRLR